MYNEPELGKLKGHQRYTILRKYKPWPRLKEHQEQKAAAGNEVLG